MATKESKREYSEEDMIRDFTSPAEYKSPSDLCGLGNLRVKTVNLSESAEYGQSYATTLEDDNGNVYLSYISAKQPFTIISNFVDEIVDCVVTFDKIVTKDKKCIVKMRLVKPSDLMAEKLN